MQEIARPRWPLLGVGYRTKAGVGSGFVGDERSSPFPLAKPSVEIRKTSPGNLSHSNNGRICLQPPTARAHGRRLLAHLILLTCSFICARLSCCRPADTSSPRCVRALPRSRFLACSRVESAIAQRSCPHRSIAHSAPGMARGNVC